MYPGIYEYIQTQFPGASFSQVYYQGNLGVVTAVKDWTTSGAKHILIHSLQWTVPLATAANTVRAQFVDQFNNILIDQVNVGNFNAVQYIPYFIANSSVMSVKLNIGNPAVISFVVGYQFVGLPLIEHNN